MCAQIQQHIKDVGLDKDLEESVSEIFLERWNKMHSPLHAAAHMLEPQFRTAAFDKTVMHLSFPCLLVVICGHLCKKHQWDEISAHIAVMPEQLSIRAMH